jgi:hypothetical protein
MSWEEDAACRGMDTEWWFTSEEYDGMRGRSVCVKCPVQWDCAMFAVQEGIWDGIWGGMTPPERRDWAKGKGVPRHGTLSGYQTDGCGCGLCREAKTEAERGRRWRLKFEREVA